MRPRIEADAASRSVPGVPGRFLDKADITALLGAFCFFLSAIEYMLPKPLPFMRLGIANLPILLAVDILPFRWYILLAVVKVIGMSVISGTLFSFVALFSLAGTLAAALAMWLARKTARSLISQIGVSIIGAMASNAVQIVIARYVVFGRMAWLISPLFLAMGFATGTALGIFAGRFAGVSVWYARAAGLPDPLPSSARNSGNAETAPAAGGVLSGKKEAGKAKRAERRERAEAMFSPGELALAGLAVMAAFLFGRGIAAKALLACGFAIAAWMSGRKFSLATAISVSAGIVFANLLVPSGQVLARPLGFGITKGALLEGIEKALTFEGLMLLSKASIMPGLQLPGRLGNVVAAAFRYYDRIIESKGKIKPSTLARDADALMLDVWESPRAEAGREAPAADPPQRRKGRVILVLAVLVSWALALLAPSGWPF